MGRQKDVKESSVKTRRIVYIICEGLTEIEYLKNFNLLNRTTGKFEITFPYRKDTFDRRQTDRMQLVDMLYGEVELQRTGKFTTYRFVTEILHVMFDDEVLPETNVNELRDFIISYLESRGLHKNDYSYDFESMKKMIMDCMCENKKFDYCSKLCDIDNSDRWHPKPKTSIKDIDRYFIVFDRDLRANCFERERIDSELQYESVFKRCEELGYEVLMSTPLFEIWLLMHHANSDTYYGSPDLSSKMSILNNLKLYEQDGCDDWDLAELDKVKRISKDRLELYYNENGFKTAVKKSKGQETNLYKLLNNVGTNVGIKLESLL